MEKIKLIAKSFLTHELISGTFFIFIGTTIANFLAFVLNIYFARNLSYADYGTFSALLSLFALAVVPAASIGAIVTKFATRFITLNEDHKAAYLYKKITKYLVVGTVISIIITTIFSSLISRFLKIDDNFLILLLVITTCANYFLVLNINFLNSLLRFKFISFSYAISGLIKIIIGVAFVYAGFRVYGALGSVLALIIGQYFITLFPLRKIVGVGGAKTSLPVGEVLKFSIPATIAAIALYSFVSSDVIMVKHYFNSQAAGFYGALSLIGRVIFYFSLPVPQVMFPLLVKRHSMNQAYNRLFYLALLIVTLPSLAITAFYFLFPEFTIKLFLGGRDYLTIAPYLALFGLFLTIYSLNNTFVNYFLSVGKTKIFWVIILFAAAQILGINYFHENFTQVISVSIATSFLLLVSLVISFLRYL